MSQEMLESQVLSAARSGLSPTSEQLQLQLSTLAARVQAGDVASLNVPTDSTALGHLASSLAKWGPFKLLSLGGAVGIALGFMGGVMMTQTSGHASRVSERSDRLPSHTSSATRAQVATHAETEKTIEVRGHDLTEPADLAEEDKLQLTADVAKVSTPPPGALLIGQEPRKSENSVLYQEISYLRLAQSALRDGHAVRALGLMESLDEVVSPGALSAERQVTKVLSLCALDRNGEAQEIADSLRQALPGSPYAARISNTCASETEP